MGFFSKRQKEGIEQSQQEVAERIVNRILGFQRRWANGMQGYSERLSKRGKVVVLVIGVLMTGAMSLLLILDLWPVKARHKIDVGKASRGIHLEDIPLLQGELATARIQRLKMVIDSLSLSAAGREQLKEIENVYPGLLDSMAMMSGQYRELERR